MKKKRILGLLLTGALLIGTFGACSPAEQQPTPPTAGATVPTPPQTTPAPIPEASPPHEERPIGRGLTVAVMSETSSIGVARHASVIGHHKNILTHNGLFRAHPDGHEPLPDLISGFTAISDTVFDFYLHEGVMFHNGEILDAYDVAASFEYVRTTPDQRSVHGSMYSWEVIDSLTIRIDTGEPNALFFRDLAHQGNFIMPRSLIESGHDLTSDPVGSGPFIFEEWRFGDSLRFYAFENYFDEDRSPMLAYVHWRIIPEGSSRTIALETGEVDYIVDVAFPDIPRLQENSAVSVIYRPGTQFSYLIMNNELPQFENVYARRAIDMALDRDAMLTVSLDGWGVPIWTVVPPALPGATTEGTRGFDPDGAKALLAEQSIDPTTLAFEMLAFNEEQRRRAEVAQSNLNDIGIPTTITMIDFAAWGDQTRNGDFEATFANFTSPSLVGFMRSLLTIEFIDSQNRSRIRHEELSDLIAQAIITIDAPAREAILEQAVIIANEQVPHIGTNMNVIVRAFNANLVTPELGPNGFMYFNVMYWAN